MLPSVSVLQAVRVVVVIAITTTTLTACNTETEGNTSVNDDGSNVTIVTCPANGDELVTNTVQIE